MDQETREFLMKLWEGHWGKAIGLAAGLIVGAAILLVGFWNTVFVLCCGMIGLFIGVKLDSGKSPKEFLESVRESFLYGLDRWR